MPNIFIFSFVFFVSIATKASDWPIRETTGPGYKLTLYKDYNESDISSGYLKYSVGVDKTGSPSSYNSSLVCDTELNVTLDNFTLPKKIKKQLDIDVPKGEFNNYSPFRLDIRQVCEDPHCNLSNFHITAEDFKGTCKVIDGVVPQPPPPRKPSHESVYIECYATYTSGTSVSLVPGRCELHNSERSNLYDQIRECAANNAIRACASRNKYNDGRCDIDLSKCREVPVE
ncbi:MAG: hypothetical protein ACXVB4_16700 [Pseudobdellovibrionaceae bacterium]